MFGFLVASLRPELLLFPETFFSVLVYGALGGTAMGLVALLWLILRDRKKGKIW